MSKKKVDILGVHVDSLTMGEAVKRIQTFIEERTSVLIATANAEMLMLATYHRELKNILNDAALIVPDGAGTVWAAHHLGHLMPERVAGYDLAQELMRKAPQKGYRLFFFGAAPGVAEKAKTKAEKLYPGIEIVGVRNGFFSSDRRNFRRYGGRHEACAALDAESEARMALSRGYAAEESGASHGIAALRIQGHGIQKEWTKKGRSSIISKRSFLIC